MPRSRLVLAAGLLALALLPASQQPAAADCVGPYLDLAGREVLSRGAEVTVRGGAFVDGCRDTMTCSGILGCSSCGWDEPEPVPYDDVALTLVQGGRTWDVGVVDADEDGRLAWTFELPAGVEPGRARLVAEHAEPVVVRVR